MNREVEYDVYELSANKKSLFFLCRLKPFIHIQLENTDHFTNTAETKTQKSLLTRDNIYVMYSFSTYWNEIILLQPNHIANSNLSPPRFLKPLTGNRAYYLHTIL